MRYSMYWALIENNAYDAVNKWSTAYKSAYGLYRFTRNIYNPAYRLASFHRAHIWGGRLDVKDGAAGEGGALPIKTNDARLRTAIATLWRASNWEAQKDIVTLWAATMGDGAIKIMADEERGRVYLQPIHPGTLKDVAIEHDNVKSYTIERAIKEGDKDVIYTERATRDGDDVVYETFKDRRPWDWGNGASVWRLPYGFIPLVMIQHNNVGLDWGWSELHPCVSKVREVDDIASKTSDQIRKMVDAPWMLAGVAKPVDQPKTKSTSAAAVATADGYANPQDGRQEVPMLYGPVGATATAMVAPLDLAATLEHIAQLNGELEKEFPELRYEFAKVTGDISGRALRIARQDVVTKTLERRTRYDAALVRAQQMAVAMGGHTGYAGFEGFSLESFAAGELDHEIGERPVFADDEMDKLDLERALWEAAGAAQDRGVPLDVFLKRQGWTPADIAAIVESDEYRARSTVAALGLLQPRSLSPGHSSNHPAGNSAADSNGAS